MVKEIVDDADLFGILDASRAPVPAGQSPVNPAVVLVDFWAPWCGPCVKFSPTLEFIAREFQGRVTVVKVNCDDLGDLSQRYSVSALPTFLAFVKGEKFEQVTGASKESVTKLIERALATLA